MNGRGPSRTWNTVIKCHWDESRAIDFTTIEVWTTGGLITYCVLFAMELAARARLLR